MTSIVYLIQQRILHHDGLKKLKQADDTNSITAFQNFATQFVTFSTAKDREIQNSIHAINFNLNDLIIVGNDDAEMRYEAKKNEKKLQHDCYDSSYAPMLVAMLMTMLMAMLLAIVGRSSLGYRVVSKPTLFRVSLCSSESYR